ncbi:hypothetical protein ONS95_004592 [Cadophora gregata]|uniref:uncharacterized protein n=1 Tax=Cadophora gregata TaxID=51156 RepID=UPI0026DD8C5E|nr:uncharacterized protein ONS95_004592 [Cadophora gregata]KAK0105040.1 hypothetical protein ONS96_004445 [Cadophora gregata f. sp. sojae]KAK0106088.1 hypothetical protein ONS95_004592 [Cadophora gregata]
MAFSDSKEGYTSIAAPSSTESHHDVEKAATTTTSPKTWAYGTFMIKDAPEVESEKMREGRRGAFNAIILSLVASLLLVGAFTLGSFVVVTVFLG